MRLGKSRQLIFLAATVICLEIRAETPFFFPAKLGDNPWDARVGVATATGSLLLPLDYQQINRISENMFWCSSPESIMTLDGDIQPITKFFSTNGVPIFNEIFAYNTDISFKLPIKISKDLFYTEIIRDRKPVPVIIFGESGVLQETAQTSLWDLSNAHLTFISSGQGYRIYSLDTRQELGPVYAEISLGLKNAFVRNGDKWRLIKEENGTLQDVLGMEFDDAKYYKYFAGLWLIEKDGKQGLVTEDGIWMIPLQDDFQISNSQLTQCDVLDKFAIVSAKGKANLFDLENKRLVFKKWFRDIPESSDQIAACSVRPQEYFLVDIKSKKRLKGIPPYESFQRKFAGRDISSPFWEAKSDEGFDSYWVKDGKVNCFKGMRFGYDWFDVTKMVSIEKYRAEGKGVVNAQTGEIIVAVKRDQKVEPWADKVKVIDGNGQISVVNSMGKVLVGRGERVSLLEAPDSSGYARIVCDGKAGLIDSGCRFVLPCRYEDVWHFGEGLVPAKDGGKWGFVELPGRWAIPPEFEEARAFKDGFAPVSSDGKWGFIGRDGQPRTPFAYEDVIDVREGHFRAKTNGKWGIFALDGTCTLPAEYDRITASDEQEHADSRD